ncbi:LysR family transcriptional regulator [Mycobacterium ulcerans]|uniref:LysR family transcriptional regulator n=1 Tax=Mycobacterium ulcerans TaxID=1809 RepID=UPI0012DEE2EF|nr:LysR family transcriptional regulator [Mycobacterium ulcerans]MEB3967960.1 LysR family transcriptional regulator [Mycobacterium ulcerans]MEB3977736.1 LysR family transcriptional regulator [Mycobacterium ulcerans]MEB4005421.1 LysR family transcriptional regulator [Mycobacterium ulcerans]MEB4416636.1 LysR family transcriptional regulator [Mycobacterium ulcerans]MEB4433152.1 LysR family transcriptional regulator [Mycobacterium ulcerans]
MELYQLRYFQAVAECGTLRGASEQLLVSQSAVSRAITLLEAEIGVQLFTRRGRTNELNRYGQALLVGSRLAQRSVSSAIDNVRELAGVSGGTVALGFLHSLGMQTVPHLIRLHHSRFPQARFELHQRSGQGVLSDLVSGVTDVSLSFPAAFEGYGEIAWQTLFTQQLYAVVSTDHPLAGRRLIRFPELAAYPFVVLDRDHTLRRIVDAACARHGIDPTPAFEGTDVGTLRGLIGANLGVGVLPQATARPADIIEIAIDDAQLVRPIAIGWIADRCLPSSAVAFRETALGCYGHRDSAAGV